MNKKTVYRIDRVTVSRSKGDRPGLSITSHGVVPTPGWSQPELIPYVYIVPPADGILDFNFIAEPPDETVGQVLTSIVATYPIEDSASSAQGIGTSPLGFGTSPVWVRGVRVHASDNTKEALIDEGSKGGKAFVKGTLTNEGIECQVLRGQNDELYTLVGDLKGFKVGDTVYVLGAVVPISFCTQGITIAVDWISKDAPRCS